MDHATQVSLLKRLLRFLDGRTTELADLPYVNRVSTYTSPEQLERERAVLFRRAPLFLGLSCDLGAPGSYLAADHAGVPVLAVRTSAGTVRAFIGLCRHRGAQLVSESGKGNGRFQCPYHGWTYDDAGHLIAQPCREGFEGIDRDSLGLVELPVAERYGMLFARASGTETIDVDALLGGAQRELEPLGLGRYRLFARSELRRDINWKLAIDTFLEAYHVSHLHERTLGPAIYGAPAAWDPFGRGGRLIAARRSIASVLEQSESTWDLFQHSVILYQLFPNTMLIHQIDHVEVVQAFPGSSPDSARIAVALYTPEPVADDGGRRHFQKNMDLLLEVTDKEDFRIAEQMQRGFHVDPESTVIYGRNEPALAHYHCMLAAALKEGEE